MTELKPCPFCGSDNIEWYSLTPDREGIPKGLSCGDCGISGPWTYDDSPKTAINRWNTRHIQEGYALVPIEPTEKMIDEGSIAYVHGGTIEAVYKAMITAAQEEA